MKKMFLYFHSIGLNVEPRRICDVQRLTCAYLYWTVLVLLLVSVQFVQVTESLSLAPVYWNSSNPLFKASTSSSSIEVQLRDDIDLTCPYYPSDAVTEPALLEYYIIYQVSKKEYDDCNLYLSNGTAFMLVNCSAPDVKRRYTILFDPFPAIPNVPEYHSGQTYYFITTSTGQLSGLSNTRQGACADRNMKLSISVCCSTTKNVLVPNNPSVTGAASSNDAKPLVTPELTVTPPMGQQPTRSNPSQMSSNAPNAPIKPTPSLSISSNAFLGANGTPLSNGPGAKTEQIIPDVTGEQRTNHLRTSSCSIHLVSNVLFALCAAVWLKSCTVDS